MDPRTWFRAGQRARELRLDALVYKWWIPFFGAAYAPVLAGAKKGGAVTIMIADNLVPHEKRPLDGFLTRLVTDRTDGYLVMSKAVEEDARRLLPGALVRRVPHPVYAQYGAPGLTREAARALRNSTATCCCSSVSFAATRARRPHRGAAAGARCPAGDPRRRRRVLSRSSLRARIARLGTDEHVRVLDRYVPDEEVGDLVAAADCVVLPYRAATQSGVVLVAYAGGCPVISTAVGGLPEVVDDGVTGYLVPPEDPDALAAAILRFFDEGGRASFEAAVARKAQEFSWNKVVEGIERLTARVRA
jgi:hypothetical protein